MTAAVGIDCGFFFFQAEDGIRDYKVTGVQTCALPISVRAPFTGVVIAKAAQVGEIVSPLSAGGGFTRTGIGTIVDMDSLEIEVDVNEAYINRVQPGQPVESVLNAYPDWRIPSHVIAIIPDRKSTRLNSSHLVIS